MRVLLLSAYDAGSHRYWHDGLVKNLNQFDWTRLCLPPRYFNWRIRGNPLSWFIEQKSTLTRPYDLLIATSMVDVATLKGLIPSLAATPTLVYFHENQFAYPPSSNQFKGIEAQMVTLYNALAADRIVFNSSFNRDTYLTGIDNLVLKMPDHCPKKISDQLQKKSEVLSVPLENSLFEPVSTTRPPEPLTLVWNHRWEYDKGPERLFRALLQFRETGTRFKLHILGKRFRRCPAVFKQIQTEFSPYIGYFGPIESRSDYLKVLQSSHIVISTALHEFQGLAILEAIACGCIPAVPGRLSYPEFLGPSYLYPSWPENESKEAEALSLQLTQLAAIFVAKALPSPPNINQFSWKKLGIRYRLLMENTRIEGSKDREGSLKKT